MTSSDLWDEGIAARYDADAADRFAPEVLGPTVDLLARLAGLEPEARFADWDGSPFTAESTSHVSVWRRPPAVSH